MLDCLPSTTRVNVCPSGAESNGDVPGGHAIGMSGDGRLVVFARDR